MYKLLIFLALVISLLASIALVWQWGIGGLGLGMFFGLTLVSTPIYLIYSSSGKRDVKKNKSSTQSEPVYETQNKDTDRLLPLVLNLANQAVNSNSFANALHELAYSLQLLLKSREFYCLRVESWNGDTALVRPWNKNDIDEDHIDPTTMSVLKYDQVPLGNALVKKAPCYSNDVSKGNQHFTWRTSMASKVIAVPVMVNDWPVALLEFIDPEPPTEDQIAVLKMASAQLGLVAQRDNTKTRIANDAEHLGRLGLVASRISSGVAVLDRHGMVEWINPMFVALSGWSHQKILGRSLSDVLRSELKNPLQGEEVARFLLEGGPFRIAFEGSRKTASVDTNYWAELDAILMLDEIGGRSQYVCLLNDITERKQQELFQAQEREFLEALLGNLPISLIVTDTSNFCVAAINRFAEFELGLKHDQVVKHPLLEVLGQAALAQAEPFMQQAINGKEAVEHDFTWWKDEKRITVHARHFALRHANGDPRLLISLVRDISQYEQTRADMEESERRFREIVESMDDCVYVATEAHEKITYVSSNLPALLGLTQETLLNQAHPFESLVIAEDKHILEDALINHKQLGDRSLDVGSCDVVVRIQHRSRGLRWIRWRNRMRQLGDGQIRIYGLLSDVSDDKTQAMELSRAKDEAVNASRAKSQFMASMSHEIRTPMNAILGLTELLLGTNLNEQQRRHAQLVYQSGENLLEIINDILDFSKIESGHLELANTEFSIQSLLDDVLELIAHKAHEKGLEITAHVDPKMPAAVIADPLRLQQILTNLISNAIKFTEHGEVAVTVSCDQIEPSEKSDVNISLMDTPKCLNVEFLIRDTGIGIANHVLPKLFSAFTQANASLARRYGGTGLGLAITKQLVELMGGKISVESALGIGSKFRFNIPVTAVDGFAETGYVNDLIMPRLNILVVDDNATNRTVLENILTSWGMNVVSTCDGQEALDYLLETAHEDRHIDMALVDMRMPRVDGFDFAKKLRSSGRYKRMQMLLLSSTSTSDDVRESKELGYSRFVAKPLRKPELRQAILGLSAEFLTPTEQLPNLRLNVLVIEDNAVNREVCAQMLVRLGCRAYLASSAMEGLKKLCELHFDIILLDIAMPGMDGEETIQQFRSTQSNRFKFVTPKDTPVIAVTAHVEEEKFMQLGFNAFLRKPYRLHQLERVLGVCKGSPKKHALIVDESPTQADDQSSDRNSWPESDLTKNNDQFSASLDEVFDHAVVKRLLDLDPNGNNNLIERVVNIFHASLDKYIQSLEEATRTNDIQSIKDIVHTLKSSSANVGAMKLSQCCIDVEIALQTESPELLKKVESIKNSAHIVQLALPRLLQAYR